MIGLESIMDTQEKGIIALRFIYKGDYYDQMAVCSRGCLAPLSTPEGYIETYSHTNRYLILCLIAFVLGAMLIGCLI